MFLSDFWYKRIIADDEDLVYIFLERINYKSCGFSLGFVKGQLKCFTCLPSETEEEVKPDFKRKREWIERKRRVCILSWIATGHHKSQKSYVSPKEKNFQFKTVNWKSFNTLNFFFHENSTFVFCFNILWLHHIVFRIKLYLIKITFRTENTKLSFNYKYVSRHFIHQLTYHTLIHKLHHYNIVHYHATFQKPKNPIAQ